jgi:hypothetical protein
MNKKILLVVLGVLFSPTFVFAQIVSLNGQTGATQNFVNDENITMSSDSDTHTLGWNGFLSPARGGLGVDASAFSTGSIPFFDGSVFAGSSNLLFNGTDTLTVGPENTPFLFTAKNATTTNDYGSNLIISGGNGNGSGGGGQLSLGSGNGGETGNGGDLTIQGGAGGTTLGHGGALNIQAGGSGMTDLTVNSLGSNLNLAGGSSTGVDLGGNIVLTGGYSFNAKGGNVDIYGGVARDGSNNNDGGDINLIAGTPLGSGYSGTIILSNSDASQEIKLKPAIGIELTSVPFGASVSSAAILDTTLLTTDHTYTFPDASGTFPLLESTQNFSGINTFSNPVNNFISGTTSTIHVGASGIPGCIVMGDKDGSGVTYIMAKNGNLITSTTKPAKCH